MPDKTAAYEERRGIRPGAPVDMADIRFPEFAKPLVMTQLELQFDAQRLLSTLEMLDTPLLRLYAVVLSASRWLSAGYVATGGLLSEGEFENRRR